MKKQQGKMEMKNCRRVCLAAGRLGSLAVALLSVPVAGAGGAFDLGETVITGDPLEKTVADLPFPVTVVDRAAIEASGAATFSDVLSTLPGVFVHRTGDFGRTDPEIRGLGQRGRQTVILVDGVPVKMSLYGCAVTHALPIGNVERIEVARGPQSVLYGSDALGGVVNIVTRRLEADGYRTDLAVSGGSHGTGLGRLAHGGRGGRFDYFITAERLRSDGHRPESAYRAADYGLRLGFELAPTTTLTLFGKHFHGEKEEPGPLGGPAPPPGPDDYERTVAYLRLAQRHPADHFDLTLSHNYGHHRLADGWHSRDNIYGAHAAWTGFGPGGHQLTLGADWKWSEGDRFSAPPGAWHRREHGVYAWHQHQRGELGLTVGGRYQHDSVAGGVFCPQAGAVYVLSEASRLRASAGRAFRFPAMNDLFLFPPSSEDLKPETVDNYELGFDRRLTRWLTATGTVFAMSGRDLIEPVANPAPPPPVNFRNAGRFRFRGAEAGLEARWAQQLLTVHHSFLDPGENTRGRPGHKLDLRYRRRWGGLALEGGLQQVSRYYAADGKAAPLPSFLVADLRLGASLGGHYDLFLAVDNLFDKDYLIWADLPGAAAGRYPMPGRTFRFGVNASF